MADKFERHKSTRWVRASVPAYGEDWNDDDGYNYDYGYGSGTDSDGEKDSDHKIVAERFILPDHEKDHQKDQNEQEGQLGDNAVDDKLVLSIDRLATEDNSGSDTEDEPVETESVKPEHEGEIVETVIPVHPQAVKPPTPSYSDKFPIGAGAPQTPLSEQSFQSDADSIQNETDLRVAAHKKSDSVKEIIDERGEIDQPQSPVDERISYSSTNEQISPSSMNEQISQSPVSQHFSQSPMDEHVTKLQLDEHDSPQASSTSKNGDNLVLSIDNRNFDSDSDSDKEDAVPYYERKLDDPETDEERSITGTEKDSSYASKADPLDSFISDLQNSYSNDKEMLPPIESKVSLPDFENNYSYYDYDYDEDDNEGSHPVTPIAPLSTADEKNFHEKYVSELSGHKQSIRKPPQQLDGHQPLTKTLAPLMPEASNEPVDSPTYSSFGDAVDAYMSDKGSLSTLNKSELDYSSQSDSDIETDKEQEQELSQAERSFEPEKELDLEAEDDEEEKPRPTSLDTVDESTQALGPQSTEDLHPVNSTGSLSTGKLSFDPRSDFEPPSAPGNDKDLNRRDSTMSTNTFSMGGWTPNTNNFRDQFINENDNESTFNFNMNDNSGYQKFTKHRSVSDNMSFVSANSMPETVDIPLPSIHEDPDLDEEGDDTFSSENQTNNTNDSSGNISQGLGISNTTTNSDSILQDKEYTDKFKEEFSQEENSPSLKSQGYTSLLSPVPDDESKRAVSGSTMSTEYSSIAPSIPNSDQSSTTVTHTRAPSSTSTSTFMKSFPSNAYPVSNWNSIMKTSQPIDRIKLLREALDKEYAYDTGLQTWLNETLTKSDNSSGIHIGKIASQAYQNAAHNDLRRHVSIRSRVSSVKDKVETGGLHASNLGKKFFHRGKKLMKSNP